MPVVPTYSRRLLLRLSAWLCLWACLWLVAPGAWALDDLRFTRLFADTDQNVAGVGPVNAIVQDRLGFIWLGGENGLARFDGVNIKRYQNELTNPKALSSNFVFDLKIDHSGVMWVASDMGLLRYNSQTDDFTRFMHDPANPQGLPSNMLRALAVDNHNNIYVAGIGGLCKLGPQRDRFEHLYTAVSESDVPNSQRFVLQSLHVQNSANRLWVGGIYGGVFALDLASGERTWFVHSPDVPGSLSHNHVYSITEDYLGRLWFATFGGGVDRLNADGKTFSHYNTEDRPDRGLTSNTFFDVYSDSRNRLWFASDQGGLLRYDFEQDRFISYKHNSYDPSTLSSNQLRTLFEDSMGDLWVGAFPSGVNYHNQSTGLFTNFYHKPDNPNSLSHSAVLSVLEDSQGILWVGTESGLNRYDKTQKRFTRYLKNARDPNALQADAVLTLLEDQRHALWVGTWGGGVHRLDPGASGFRVYKPDPAKPGSVNSSRIWSSLEDRDGILWFGSEQGGLNRYDAASDSFRQFMYDPNNTNSLSENIVWSIFEAQDGDLWIGTSGSVDRFNPRNESFFHYRKLTDKTSAPDTIRIRVLRQDSRGRMWIGTQDNGVFICNTITQTFQQLTVADGLPAGQVSSILEDDDHYMWLATTNGLARVDGESLKVRVFQRRHGLPSNNFNRDASFKGRDGLLYFGSTGGLSMFDPRSFTQKQQDAPVLITDFRIFDQSITSGTHPNILPVAIEHAREVTLDYSHNMFSLFFAAVNFRDATALQYAYRLKGFDADWRMANPGQPATYTNLNPGDYVFEVKVANREGGWGTQQAALAIRIEPPFWRTHWAYTLYGFLALLLAVSVVTFLWRHFEFTAQKALNDELRNLDAMKDAFLANTSHELRTPLNGIVGMAQLLLDEAQGSLPAAFIKRLQLILFSGKRLSALINDILDYSKLKNHKLKLFYGPVNLYDAIEAAFMLLTPLAEDKSIALVNTLSRNVAPVELDENRLQQILINLITNAIKYSDQGQVTLWLRQGETSITLGVTDTGIGIAPQQLEKLFSAFSQLEDAQQRQKGGTGLGLSVTKQLVELHGGQLHVQSNLGEGSTFMVYLPIAPAYSATLPDPTAASLAPPDLAHWSGQQQAPSTDEPLPQAKPSPRTPALYCHTLPAANRVLIVDDDPVNRMVLEGLLRRQGYEILQASNGQEALNTVAEHPVDLLVLDVMMPGMTGYEVCETLRKTHPIESLPIIFLTANRSDEEVSRGFQAGGNEFLTKPVSKAELLPRVANQLHLLQCFRHWQCLAQAQQHSQ
jgi:two-component system, sensor histidine kinase ChiS